MIKKIPFIIFFLTLSLNIFCQQVYLENYPSFEVFYTMEDLNKEEKELINTLIKYFKGEKEIKEFFLKEIFSKITDVISSSKSVFLLEKPNLKEGDKKTQLQFWVKEDNSIPIRGNIFFENNEIKNLITI